VIHLPASVRVYLCTTPCDMRRSFDGLYALVNGAMQLNAFEGHLFVFSNRRRDRIKILYWDRDGFAIWAKRLEEGTYAIPFTDESGESTKAVLSRERRSRIKVEGFPHFVLDLGRCCFYNSQRCRSIRTACRKIPRS
jgi:hypothetical protein